ncbi:MAG: DEAD/DEAH box helicase [Candidatus Hodarchaeota archaeon]
MAEELKKQVLDLFKEIQNVEFGNSDWFFLLNQAQIVSLVKSFQYLLSLEDLNVTLFPHQEEAVLSVLQRMQGSALLADEVGLGKTIIALTILSELQIRDLVKSVIIMVPSSLASQWQEELLEKFNLEYPIIASGRGNFKQDQFITTLNLATRYPNKILDRSWDMVIVDEGHRVNNRRTKSWEMLNQLKKKYILILTATPMENYLEDIFNLITLLKPIFGSYRNFRRTYGVPNDKRACKDPIQLRRQLNTVMIRRKRDDIKGIFFPERVANTLQFDMSEIEHSLYDTVSDYVITSYTELEEVSGVKKVNAEFANKYNISSSRHLKRRIWLHKFTLMLLQRRACSSAFAADKTILNMINSRIKNRFDLDSLPILESFHTMASQLAFRESTKVTHLKQLLERTPGKCVIFTEFKDSLDYVSKFLEKGGFSFLEFSGSLSSADRAKTIKNFREDKDILLSTDAGSEGLNLQVANTLVNFDLPWNPMRVEQRIGRIYRLTQKAKEIYIFNLASNDTIEQYVLDILHNKIGVFRTILGDLNHILGSLIKANADGRSSRLEGEIMKFFVKHGHSEKLRQELEEMIKPVVDKIELQDGISENIMDVDVESLIERY